MITIELDDGTLVEVDGNDSYEISTGKRVYKSLKDLKVFLQNSLRPMLESIEEIGKDIKVEDIKIVVGVKISFEGNFVLAKSSADAHLSLEIKIKSK